MDALSHRVMQIFFFSSRRRHTRLQGDWSSDVCSSDLVSQSLAQLYQKATRAKLRITKANQDEILYRYKYAEGFENRVRDIRTQDSSVTEIGRASCRERV